MKPAAMHSGLVIWIVESSLFKRSPPTWKVDGFPLDGSFGFGGSNARFMEGDILLLSSKNRLIREIIVSSLHISREGFKWLIEGIDVLPEIPFLVISDANINLIFDGYIQLTECEEIIDLSEPDSYTYAVAAKNWFGFIDWQNNDLHLVAFSSDRGVRVLSGDELWTFEWDCRAGKIKSVGDRQAIAKTG